AIAVVGGLTGLGGAVAAGALFAGLNELFFQVRALAGWLEVVSAGLLAAVLLLYPGGLAANPDGVRRFWARSPFAGWIRMLASSAVREREIVGLLGPNGAGKTTLFNAILGLNSPAAGRIRLFGHDATDEPPHARARLGVARTFQVIQLFNELSVFDNLLVATHPHNHSGLLSNLVASQRTLESETNARSRVHRVLRMLNLEDIAHQGVRGLPFGTLRMV